MAMAIFCLRPNRCSSGCRSLFSQWQNVTETAPARLKPSECAQNHLKHFKAVALWALVARKGSLLE
eukprot:4291983-Alexandrium_andersonii.AAC.1